MGRASQRHRHCLGQPGPAAPSQPHAEHPGRELPTARETPGWTLQLAALTQQHSRGFRQPLSGLMESLSITKWVNSKTAAVSMLYDYVPVTCSGNMSVRMKDLTLNEREQARLKVLNSVLEYQLPTTQAAEVLVISEGQVQIVLAAYRREGAAALVHGNRGRKPRNSVNEDVATAVALKAIGKYAGFNHSLPDGGAGGAGGHSPEPPDGKPSPQPPGSAQRQAAPSPQTPGTAGADAPGGHAAADRRQSSPLAGGAGTKVRLAAGGRRCHRHGGGRRLPARGRHPGLLPADGRDHPPLWNSPGTLW